MNKGHKDIQMQKKKNYDLSHQMLPFCHMLSEILVVSFNGFFSFGNDAKKKTSTFCKQKQCWNLVRLFVKLKYAVFN